MITVAVTLLICVVVVMGILGYLFKSNKVKETSMIAAIGFGIMISMWVTFLLLMIIVFIVGGDIK